jgi:hypothetical protein
MNIIKLSLALYIFVLAVIAAITNYNTFPYGFFDDSIEGKNRHNIILNRRGEYKIRYWTYDQKDIITETGTYSDPGDNEIILTPKNGHPYKIRVWARDTKRPQYRIKP